MPYKRGDLKGQLTTAELRKLVRAHNKLYDIKIPKGITQPALVKLINKNGYNVDHKNAKLRLGMKSLPKTIGMDDVPKPKVKTELEIQKAKEAKEAKKEKEKKKVREIKKQAIKQQQEILKKKQKDKPPPQPQPKPKPAPKPVPKPAPKPAPKPVPKPQPRKKVISGPGLKLSKQTPTPVVIDPKKKPPMNLKKIKPKPKKLESYGGVKKQNKKEIKKLPPKKKGDQYMGDVIDVYGKSGKTYVEVPWLPNKKINMSQYENVKKIPPSAIFQNLIDNQSPIYLPWTSATRSAAVTYLYILAMNDNDCASNLTTYKSAKTDTAKDGKNIRPDENIKKNARQIADDIVRCWKQKKVVAQPITLHRESRNKDLHGTHANMLLWNYHMMTAEHFEPHGPSYMGGKKKALGINLKSSIAEVNKYLKEYPEWVKAHGKKKSVFKYLPPDEVCPLITDSEILNHFQWEHGGTPQKYFDVVKNEYVKTTAKMYNGVIIDEIGGYCAMWALFFLDTRLKTLQLPVADVMTELLNLADEKYEYSKPFNDVWVGETFGEKSKNVSTHRELKQTWIYTIRGMAATSYAIQLNLVKDGKLTLEELILAQGGDEDAFKLNYEGAELEKMINKYNKAFSKYYKLIDEYLKENWIKLTTGQTTDTLKDLPVKSSAFNTIFMKKENLKALIETQRVAFNYIKSKLIDALLWREASHNNNPQDTDALPSNIQTMLDEYNQHGGDHRERELVSLWGIHTASKNIPWNWELSNSFKENGYFKKYADKVSLPAIMNLMTKLIDIKYDPHAGAKLNRDEWEVVWYLFYIYKQHNNGEAFLQNQFELQPNKNWIKSTFKKLEKYKPK